jgi:pyruvate,water dikinase
VGENLYTVKLEQSNASRRDIGSKAYNLGVMLRAGLPVPPGFAITNESFEKFLKANKIYTKIENTLSGLNYNNLPALIAASQEIEDMITSSQIPDYIYNTIKESYEELSVGKYAKELGAVALDLIKAGRENVFVAVRSSSAFDVEPAGFTKSVLNVKGMSELDEAIKKCWASLFSPKAMLYRKMRRVVEFPAMGIIVQKMIDSEKSGVIYTAQPETADVGTMVIESSWGLGEGIIAGSVTPDEYTVDKMSGNVLGRNIRKKLWMKSRDQFSGRTMRQAVPKEKMGVPTLGDVETRKLWELSRRVEELFNSHPQDIEWCEERSRIFIVQVRPLDFRQRKADQTETGPDVSEIVVSGLGISPGTVRGKVKVIMNLSDLEKVERGDVIVTRMTDSDMIPAIMKSSAIITDEGGRVSDASLVSRQFGIPCITGTEKATALLKDDQEICVNADTGNVYSLRAETPQLTPQTLTEEPQQDYGIYSSGEEAEQDPLSEKIQNMPDKYTATAIKVSLSFPNVTNSVIEADGVGMLKMENILTDNGLHPYYVARTNSEELTQMIVTNVGKVAKSVYPKPVWYRALDARSDMFRQLNGGEAEPEEYNPLLGWHGIRRSLDQPDVFRCELQALQRLHEQGLNNICLMLPFVFRVDELTRVKQMLTFPIKIGIMVETPAAALEIEHFCREEISFVSLDLSNLAQLTLGVDRDNEKISRLHSEMDPAVLRLARNVIHVCRRYGVEVSLCGDAGSNPAVVEKMIEYGINSVSAEPDVFENIKSMVARTERKLLLENVRKQHE